MKQEIKSCGPIKLQCIELYTQCILCSKSCFWKEGGSQGDKEGKNEGRREGGDGGRKGKNITIQTSSLEL